MAERNDMTVADLIDQLRQFDPSLPVVLEQRGLLEYATLDRILPPCGDEDEAQRGVCLIPGRSI